jgi:hypothetical protein
MNIFAQESDLVTAKTCGYQAKEAIMYSFSESFHSLCLDKKAIIEAEIQACERLLNYSKNDSESLVIKKEIAELRMALDLLT